MIFTFLITIVFIAELIITGFIVCNLLKFDKFLLNYNDFLYSAKPKIKEIAELIHGISDQIAEIVPIWVKKIKDKRDEIILRHIMRLMSEILFWSINIKIVNKVRKSKFVKAAAKGLTLLQSVV